MKVHFVTPGFVPFRLFEKGLEYLKATRTITDFEHYFLDNHYPISRERNAASLKDLCRANNITWVDSGRDIGLHMSLNNWLDVAKPSDDDIMIGFDADSQPLDKGWDQALVDVLTGDSRIAVCGLYGHWFDDIKKSTLEAKQVNNVNYGIHPNTDMYNISGWNIGHVRKIGGFDQHYKLYGTLEACMWSKWSQLGLKVGYLLDYRETVGEYDMSKYTDEEYLQWKKVHLKGFQGGLEAWIECGQPVIKTLTRLPNGESVPVWSGFTRKV